MGDVLQVRTDGHYSILLSHGPTKVGQPGLTNYPGLTPDSGHIVAILIASARTLHKCSRWHTKFGVLLLRLCCGCVEGAKVHQWALLSRKRPSRLHLLQFIAAQEEQQTVTITCCVAHLLHSCKKEAFESSPGFITGSNPLHKDSKADISLSLYTLPHFSI